MNDETDKPQNKASSLIPLIVGIVGFATAIITNADKVNDLYASIKTAQSSRVPGKWTGIFREYVSEKDQELVTTEIVRLRMRGSTLSGEIETADNMNREWKISGEVLPGDGALIINYVTKEPKRQ